MSASVPLSLKWGCKCTFLIMLRWGLNELTTKYIYNSALHILCKRCVLAANRSICTIISFCLLRLLLLFIHFIYYYIEIYIIFKILFKNFLLWKILNRDGENSRKNSHMPITTSEITNTLHTCFICLFHLLKRIF